MSANLTELEENLKNARERNDTAQETKTLLHMADHFQKSRRLPKAAALIAQALKLRNADADPQAQMILHAQLGCVYWEMAQLKKSMTQFEETRQCLKRSPHAEGAYWVQVLVAVTHWRKCQWQEGLAGFADALKLGAALTEATEERLPFKETLERGILTLENRIQLARQQNDPLRLLQPLFSLAPLYLFMGRKNEMTALLDEVALLAEKLGKRDIADALPQLQLLLDAMD